MEHSSGKQVNSYYKLAYMLLASFVAMYALMYAMVDSFANVFNSYNQFYMAGLMTMPMLVIELLLMGMMYKNKKLNSILIGLGVILGFTFWSLIRTQTGVDDIQFVRSMIPHHGGAVLMCENVKLTDPELIQFCQNIVAGQNGEIEQMKRIMERLNK